MLVAAAGVQYVQAQHLGLTGNLCRSLRDLPLCLQLPGTAGWVKAELSSSNQGYTRLSTSRCVLASSRGRKVGAGALGRGQGFQWAGLKALAGMAKHSALEPPHPYSAGRTHRLHGGELSPSNTPLPVGNPNPHAPTSCGWSVPSPEACTLPAGAGRVCWGGGEGKPASLPHVCRDGWAFSQAPQPRKPPPGLGDAHVRPGASLPAPCSAGHAALGGCRAPCCRVLSDALSANCSCSDAFVYFSLLAPSPLHPPTPRKRGIVPDPLELGWKGSTLNLYGESSGCQPLVCCASSSVPSRNIVPARERQENLVKGLRQPLQSASCTSGCWRGRGGEGRGQAFPGGWEGALAKMSPPKGTCTGCV